MNRQINHPPTAEATGVSLLAAAPGPASKRLLGNLSQVKGDFLGTMARWHAEYGDVVKFRLGMRTFFMVSHPELAEEVLIKQQDVFTKIYNPQKPRGLALVLGQGLVTSRGMLWQKQRRTIQPMFHRSQLAGMVPAMNRAADALLADWDARDSDQAIDICGEMMRLTLEVITQTMFSSSVQEALPRLGPALGFVLSFAQNNFFNPLAPPLIVPTRANRRFKQAMSVLHDVIVAIIERRRKDRVARDDLLDLLLHAKDQETGESMDEQQIIDEALTIFSAGHETTANALSWSWYLLAKYPEVRRWMNDEIDSVLQGRMPESTDLNKLPFTRAVLEEAIRLYPPAALIVRSVSKETSLRGFRIPKGTFVLVNVRNIQRHAQLWHDPLCFNPERFLPQQRAVIPRLAYLPFGAGPRVCVGNHLALTEGQLLLARIAQRYELDMLPGHPVEEKLAITLRPKYGLKMHLTKRRFGDSSYVA